MGKWITAKKIDDFLEECDVHVDREVEMFYEDRRQLYPPIGDVMRNSFNIVVFVWFTLSVVMFFLFIVIAVMTFFVCMIILITFLSAARNDGFNDYRRIGYRHAVAFRRRQVK